MYPIPQQVAVAPGRTPRPRRAVCAARPVPARAAARLGRPPQRPPPLIDVPDLVIRPRHAYRVQRRPQASPPLDGQLHRGRQLAQVPAGYQHWPVTVAHAGHRAGPLRRHLNVLRHLSPGADLSQPPQPRQRDGELVRGLPELPVRPPPQPVAATTAQVALRHH